MRTGGCTAVPAAAVSDAKRWTDLIDKVKTHLKNMRMSNYKYNTWAWDYWCDVLNALEQKKRGLLH